MPHFNQEELSARLEKFKSKKEKILGLIKEAPTVEKKEEENNVRIINPKLNHTKSLRKINKKIQHVKKLLRPAS